MSAASVSRVTGILAPPTCSGTPSSGGSPSVACSTTSARRAPRSWPRDSRASSPTVLAAAADGVRSARPHPSGPDPLRPVRGRRLRATLLGGFPWGELGYSQYRQLTVIQVAELGGAHAVSFVVCAVNAAITATVVVEYRRALLGVAVAGVLLASTLGFGRMRLAEAEPAATVTIAGMQPSIAQPLKWDRSHTEATLRIYGDLTRKAAERKPDLIVWPETAAPTILRLDP